MDTGLNAQFVKTTKVKTTRNISLYKWALLYQLLHSYKLIHKWGVRLLLRCRDISLVIMFTEITALCWYDATEISNLIIIWENIKGVFTFWFWHDSKYMFSTPHGDCSGGFSMCLWNKTAMFHKRSCIIITNISQTGLYLRHPMHCPSTGPERSLLVHPSQSHPSPRTSYQLAAATKTQENRGERGGKGKKRPGKNGCTDIASTWQKRKNK